MDPNFFKRAFDYSQESIVITDAELDLPGPRIQYVNAAFSKMTGYSPEEVIGKTPRILQGPRSNRQTLARLKEMVPKGEIFQGTSVNYTKLGREYDVEWTISPIYDDNHKIVNFIAYQRDITEKLRHEKEISRRLKFEMGVASATQILVQGPPDFVNLSQSLKQMLFFTDFNSVFLLERSMEKPGFFQIILDESKNSNIQPYSSLKIDEPFEKLGLGRWCHALADGEPIVGFRGDFPLDEQWFFDRGLEFLILFPIFIREEFRFIIGWENHLSPENVKDGDILLFRTVTHWVEAFLNRKVDLEELTNHRDRLKELVDAQVKDIVIAKEEAESANKMKSEFLTKISHELRTPLNSILGFSKLIDPKAPKSEDQKYLDYIYNSGNHLLKLINEILDLSKIEAGKFEIHIQPLLVSSILEAVLHMLTPQAKKKEIRFVFNLLPTNKEPKVLADQKRIQQVLLNLLSNAIFFSPLKGEISIKCDISKKEYLIEIKDEGPGISEENQGKLFQNFFQVKKEENSNYPAEGTGLGLSISKKLMELQNGKISVSSGTGSGSTFSLRLPLHPD